jgi:calcium/calmodulin-dependent protein kinase I
MIKEFEPKTYTTEELKDRFQEREEIYNEEMSPTQVELGFDH